MIERRKINRRKTSKLKPFPFQSLKYSYKEVVKTIPRPKLIFIGLRHQPQSVWSHRGKGQKVLNLQIKMSSRCKGGWVGEEKLWVSRFLQGGFCRKCSFYLKYGEGTLYARTTHPQHWRPTFTLSL